MGSKKLISALDQDVLNSEQFFRAMNRLTGASIGVIAVRTREPARAKELLHQWASLMDMDFRVWTILSGYEVYDKLPTTDAGEDGNQSINTPDDVSQFLKPKERLEETADLGAALDWLAKREEQASVARTKVCAVFAGLDIKYFDDMQVRQYVRNHTQRAYQSEDRMIFLLEPGAILPDPMLNDIEVIDLLPPSYAELMETLGEYDENIKDQIGFELDDAGRELIVQNAIGMTGQEFENSLSLTIIDVIELQKATTDYKVSASDFVNVIKQRKLEILKNTEILELLKEARLEDVGGLELLKDWLGKRSKTFSAKAREFGIQPPKGMLLVGPPGTAKSLIGRGTGDALGIPTIKVSLDRVFGSLVGQSEGRLRGALQMLDEMAPCVAFIDEIDKMFSVDNGGDSGVSKRILGIVLTWMQEKHDKRIPIFVVASANNVDSLPPELVRKGRFDEIFSVSFPSEVERADIFRIHVRMRGHDLDKSDYIKLAQATPAYVGGEIEAIVEEALVQDFDAGNETLQLSTLLQSAAIMKPQSKTFPERIERMRKWAETNARASSSSNTFNIEEVEPPSPSRAQAVVQRPVVRKRPVGLRTAKD